MSMPSPVAPAIAPSAQDSGAHLHAAAAGHRDARRPRIGPSVLRLSLAARLGIVAALLLPLWVAVFLVVRG
ncbi:hypothetical protein ACI7BZ_13225 [Xanthobacter sp. AM11]|uniref:hypothetical protein n=1 Tax=Xanthobacter sp. AM11 TaxID=3380643 RepID=UPI0039BFDFED